MFQLQPGHDRSGLDSDSMAAPERGPHSDDKPTYGSASCFQHVKF
jgi:hypothetical protein